MASLKALKLRIGSVKSTQKITKAMKMVAAAKLRRAQEAAEAGRPYAERIESVMASLASKVAIGPQSPKLIGGSGKHVQARAVRYGDGWMPTEGDPDKLRVPIAHLKAAMAAQGKGQPAIIPLTRLDLSDRGRAADQLAALAAVGVTGIEHTEKYDTIGAFQAIADGLLEARSQAGL